VKKDGEPAARSSISTPLSDVVLATFQAYGMASASRASRRRHRAGTVFPAHHRRDAGRRHHVPDVAGRADHFARHRNGSSLIIFAGIVAAFPSAIVSTLELGRQGAISTGVILGVIAMSFAVIAFIVFMERAQRRLLITYPKRQHGNRSMKGKAPSFR